MFKNTASQKLRVFAFADAGHASLDAGEPVTGDSANITAQTAVDNAALAATNDVNPAEIDATNAPGYYEFDPTQAETNGDVLEWYPKYSTAGVQVIVVGGSVQELTPPNFPDLGIGSDGDVLEVNTLTGHTAQTGDSFARIGANGASLSAIPWSSAWDAEVQSEVNDALVALHLDHLLAVTYNPASKPGASDALLNELVEDDGGVARYTANALEQAPTGGSAPTAAAIADAVWDEAKSGHTTAGSFGEEVQAHALSSEITALNDPSAAAIATAVADEAITELSSVPGASPTLKQALALLYMALRNKVDITSSAKEIHKDDGTVLGTKSLTDDGTTYSEAEMA